MSSRPAPFFCFIAIVASLSVGLLLVCMVGGCAQPQQRGAWSADPAKSVEGTGGAADDKGPEALAHQASTFAQSVRPPRRDAVASQPAAQTQPAGKIEDEQPVVAQQQAGPAGSESPLSLNSGGLAPSALSLPEFRSSG